MHGECGSQTLEGASEVSAEFQIEIVPESKRFNIKKLEGKMTLEVRPPYPFSLAFPQTSSPLFPSLPCLSAEFRFIGRFIMVCGSEPRSLGKKNLGLQLTPKP
jgi:hypothetical protein